MDFEVRLGTCRWPLAAAMPAVLMAAAHTSVVQEEAQREIVVMKKLCHPNIVNVSPSPLRSARARAALLTHPAARAAARSHPQPQDGQTLPQ
jgi:hypothetical protein